MCYTPSKPLTNSAFHSKASPALHVTNTYDSLHRSMTLIDCTKTNLEFTPRTSMTGRHRVGAGGGTAEAILTAVLARIYYISCMCGRNVSSANIKLGSLRSALCMMHDGCYTLRFRVHHIIFRGSSPEDLSITPPRTSFQLVTPDSSHGKGFALELSSAHLPPVSMTT